MSDSATPVPEPTLEPTVQAPALFLADVPPGATSTAFRQSIEHALNALALPAGKRAVLVQVKGTQDGTITLGVGARFGDGWQVEGDLERPAGGQVAAEVNLVRVW